MYLNSVRVAENSSSLIFTCASIEPPMSKNSNTFTVLWRSGIMRMSNMPPLCAVERMVLSRSSSSARPMRANLRSRRNANLMLRVPSSTESSKFLYWRCSHVFFALCFLPRPVLTGPRCPGRFAFPSSPPLPLVPWVCSARVFPNASMSFSKPPSDLIRASSSGVRCFSNSRRSHSSGTRDANKPCKFSKPLKYALKARSNLS